MARAAIDIGSNSLLLAVVDDAGAILHDEARVVGLGKGLGDRGLFRPDRMEAAEKVLCDFAATARGFGIEPWDVKAVATSGARRAINAETFFERVQKVCGLRILVISGDEEARLTWIGGQRDLSIDGVRLVVDLGGGSTELALGTADRVFSRVSLEIGSVRLTEKYLCGGSGEVPDRFDPDGLVALREAVDTALLGATLEPAPAVVVGVAGTVTTLAAMQLGLAKYDGARVHGSTLDRAALARFADRLVAADAAERRAMAAVSPERADWLLAGAVVLDRVLAAARASAMLVSDRGLRFALV